MKINGDLLTRLQNFNGSNVFLKKHIFRFFLLDYHVLEFELCHKIQTGWYIYNMWINIYIYMILSIFNPHITFDHV